MFGLGGSSSKTKSSSQSNSLDYGEQYQLSGSYLDPYQQQAQMQFQNAFNPYMGWGGQQNAMMNQQAQNQQGAYQQSRGSLAGFRQFGAGSINNFRQDLNQGTNALAQFAQQNNPFLQQQIGQLGQNIGQQYREQILPGIGSGAQMAGQRGSSRQGVAEGIAARGAMQAFSEGATGLQNNAYNQQLNAAQALSGIGMQGTLGASGQNLQALGMQGALMGQQQDYLGNVWQQQLANQFTPFQIGASIYGAPSVLNFGMGYGYDYGQSSSTSSSKGRSSSLDLGIG